MRWAGPGKGGAGTGGRDLAEVRLVGTAQGARRFGAERQGVFSREFEGNAVFFFFRRADLRAVGGRGPSEVRAARGASEITEGRDGRGSQSGERACWAAARRGRGSRRA